jgi:hypothetical protein
MAEPLYPWPRYAGLLTRNESRLLLSKPCSYCGAPIQWNAAPTPPEDDCCTGEGPR